MPHIRVLTTVTWWGDPFDSNHRSYYFSQLAALQIRERYQERERDDPKVLLHPVQEPDQRDQRTSTCRVSGISYLQPLTCKPSLEVVRARPYHYRSYNLAAMIVRPRIYPASCIRLTTAPLPPSPHTDQRAPGRARWLRCLEPDLRLRRHDPGRGRLYDDHPSGQRRPDRALPERRRGRSGVQRQRPVERCVLLRVPRRRAADLPGQPRGSSGVSR